MLSRAVQSYLAVRRATGYTLKGVGLHLRSFAAFSDACGQRYVNTQTAIEWARQAPSVSQRARRLATVARLARYLQAEDARHEIPPPVFGRELCAARPIPPYLHYCPVRAFGSPRPFGCDTKISLRTGS